MFFGRCRSVCGPAPDVALDTSAKPHGLISMNIRRRSWRFGCQNKAATFTKQTAVTKPVDLRPHCP